MNPPYPQRLLKFIAICIMVVGVLGVSREIGHLRNNIHNLSSIDKQSSFLAIGLLSLVLICCVGTFKRKIWGWIGMTSYLIYSIGGFLFDSYKYGQGDYLLITIIPVLVGLFGILVILFSTTATKYFNIRETHKVIAFILPMLVYFTIAQNPIQNSKRVNQYYVDTIQDRFYLNDSLFSGTIFTNHQNGSIKLEGKVIRGYKDGWSI